MTEEEKDLLLKDLCSRLPYGVMVKTPYNNAELIGINGIVRRKGYTKGTEYIDVITDKQTYPIRYVTPYLRPISSMTEEESAELSNIISEWFDKELFYLTEEPFLEYALSRINYSISPLLFDWLNKNHFDYRGLIERGLAIEVTEENNPYKNLI